MEEDQFSGEEPSDDIDEQRLHETISSIEKSLEELPEILKHQNIHMSETLSNEPSGALSAVEENHNSELETYQSDSVDAQLPEKESSSVQMSDTTKVADPETHPKKGNSSKEAILESPSSNPPSPSKNHNGLNLEKDGVPQEGSKSSEEAETGLALSKIPEKDKVIHDVCRSSVPKEPEDGLKVDESSKQAEVVLTVSKSPKKLKAVQGVSKSPEKAETVLQTSKSPKKTEVVLKVSTSPDEDENIKGVKKSPEKANAVQEDSKSSEKLEVAQAVSISPAKGNEVCRSPEKADLVQDICSSHEVLNEVSFDKVDIDQDFSKSLERTEVAQEKSQNVENKEVVQGGNLNSGNMKVMKDSERNMLESEDFSEPVTVVEGPEDIDNIPSQAGSKGFGHVVISPRRKRERSPEKEVDDHRKGSSEDYKILNNSKKLKTPPKEMDKMLPESNTEKVFKKRGRPSLADKMRRSNAVNLTENVEKSKISSNTGNEDITPKTKNIDQIKKSTTSDDIVTPKTKQKQQTKPLRRLKKDSENEEDISLFLPEDWIFMGSVRQAGSNVGHVDIYYWTPPPRIKLRSRQELQTYMNKHGLDYDPLNFFVRSHVPHLIKSGALKYYDSRTIISSNADEATIKQFKMQKAPRGSLSTPKTESAVESATRKPEKTVHTKRSKDQKSLSKKKPGLKRKYRKLRQTSLNTETMPPSTKSNVASSEPGLRKRREKNTGPTTKSLGESLESVNKGLKESDTVTVKTEITSPDSIRKTRLRSSTTVVEPPPMLPVKTTKRSNQVLEVGEPVSSPKTPVKGKMGRPRKSVPPPRPSSPPLSETNIDQRVIIHSKPKIVRSPYFSSSSNIVDEPKSLAGRRRDKNCDGAPPRSPFNLIQEDLFHDPWQMLIATIFLNSTSGRIAIPLALEFLKRWPTPQEACQAKLYDILDVIEPLGFGRTRAAIIIRFSHEFLTKDWKLPSDLYGIGKYGTDSYKIFCMKNAWKRVESDDPLLMMYLNWRRATEHLRKKFLNSGKNTKAVDPDESVINPDKVTSNVQQNKDQSLPLPRKRLRTRTK